MKIKEITAMRGPNYWSVRRHKLIVMVLDIVLKGNPVVSITAWNEEHGWAI